MDDQAYTTISCTACRPKHGSVWIVIDGAGGITSEHLSLSSIHPDDVTDMKAAEKVQAMELRVIASVADAIDINAGEPVPHPEPCDMPAEPMPSAVPAFGDLFGATP